MITRTLPAIWRTALGNLWLALVLIIATVP
jgi:hypothetical protein